MFPRFLLWHAPDVADRLAQPPAPIALPAAPEQVIQLELIEVDLYQKYVDRMDKGIVLDKIRRHWYVDKAEPLIKPSFYDHHHFDKYTSQEIFIHLFSIMLGCDSAHDFTKSTSSESFNSYINDLKKKTKKKNYEDGYKWIYDKSTLEENKKAINEYIIKANVENVMKACQYTRQRSLVDDSIYTLLAHCIFLINIEIYMSCNKSLSPVLQNPQDVENFCKDGLFEFFKSDYNAKPVSQAIIHILGINKYPSSGILNPGELQSTPNLHRRLIDFPFDETNPIKVRIDATSASINVAPEAVGLSLNPGMQNLIIDIAASSDPAWFGTLHTYYNYYFRQQRYVYQRTRIKAFVNLGQQRLYIVDSTLTPDLPEPKTGKIPVRVYVHSFLFRPMNALALPLRNTKRARMDLIINEWMTTYKEQGTELENYAEKDFKDFIAQSTCVKTLGDFLQIVSYANDTYPKAFHTFDTIASHIASVVGKTVIFDSGPASKSRGELRFVYIDSGSAIKRNLPSIGIKLGCQIVAEAARTNTRQFWKFLGYKFGKINNISKRLKLMSHSELKNKLKLVGIKITKNVRGKRKYLSRKELETKARLFNKLQNTAKRMKIKIMYKSRNGMYKYKTYIRLQKEINSKYNKNRKYKKPFVRNFNFG